MENKINIRDESNIIVTLSYGNEEEGTYAYIPVEPFEWLETNVGPFEECWCATNHSFMVDLASGTVSNYVDIVFCERFKIQAELFKLKFC